jgi:hypothetical protein
MLSSIISGIASAILSSLLKVAELFGVYQAGEKSQAQADDEATLSEAKESNEIRSKVAGDSDSKLDDELSNRMRGAGPDK